jgi:hypothetical protein
VLDGGTLRGVDPDSGDVVETRATELTEASGMDLRGDELYVCSGTSIRVLDWHTGRELRSITTTSRARSVACAGDELLVTQQPIWGHDRTHTYRQLWPAPGGGAIHRIARP